MFDDKIGKLHYLYILDEEFCIWSNLEVLEKYSKEEAKSLNVGLYVALVVLLGVVYFISQRDSVEHVETGKYYALDARFGRTDGLLVGDKVRLAGVTIGRVVNAKLDDHFNAIMTLELKDDIKIPDDSSASIVSSGLMGSKYIEIEPGGSEDYLPAGGEFAYTQDAMVIEELLDRIVSIGKSNRSKKANDKMDNMEKNLELN